MVEQPLGPLWKEVQSLLRVTAEIAESPEPDAEFPITVTFTVTNESKDQRDGPSVAFDDVELAISLEGEAETVRVGRLAPGASQTHTRSCDYTTVKDVEASVQGTAVPASMFTVTSKAGASSKGLRPESFVTTMDRLDLRGRIEEALSAIKVPSADTTLAQLEQAREQIGQSLSRIRDATERAESVYRLVGQRSIQQLHDHRAAGEYVTRRNVNSARFSRAHGDRGTGPASRCQGLPRVAREALLCHQEVRDQLVELGCVLQLRPVTTPREDPPAWRPGCASRSPERGPAARPGRPGPR